MFVAKAMEDPGRRVTLLPGSLFIGFENLADDR